MPDWKKRKPRLVFEITAPGHSSLHQTLLCPWIRPQDNFEAKQHLGITCMEALVKKIKSFNWVFHFTKLVDITYNRTLLLQFRVFSKMIPWHSISACRSRTLGETSLAQLCQVCWSHSSPGNVHQMILLAPLVFTRPGLCIVFSEGKDYTNFCWLHRRNACALYC